MSSWPTTFGTTCSSWLTALDENPSSRGSSTSGTSNVPTGAPAPRQPARAGQQPPLAPATAPAARHDHARRRHRPTFASRHSPSMTWSRPSRAGAALRLDAGPAHLERRGHWVLDVGPPSLANEAWYELHFGSSPPPTRSPPIEDHGKRIGTVTAGHLAAFGVGLFGNGRGGAAVAGAERGTGLCEPDDVRRLMWRAR